MEILEVKIKLADMDLFIKLLDTLRLVTSDERVPEDIRENVIKNINEILESEKNE